MNETQERIAALEKALNEIVNWTYTIENRGHEHYCAGFDCDECMAVLAAIEIRTVATAVKEQR